MTEQPGASFPLAGVIVLEVGNFMAAPFCTMQLADLGATVIKVETPAGGDQVRHIAPLLGGEGSSFLRLNRNKRSLALDLKSAEGKKVFRRLAGRADVIVENLRPGTMADLELAPETLLGLNPRLIYVAASGWGQDGPLHMLPGMDIMAQARSGLMSITGQPGGDPVKVGIPVTDLVCALYGALAAVSALYQRARDGRGQLIDVSLFESAVSLAVWEAGKYFATGEVPERLGSSHQTSAPYQAFRSKDGWFTIGATTAGNWSGCCKALGLEALEHDPRFSDSNLRYRNREELAALIEAVTTTAPASHWLAALEAAGVPCAPIQDFGQVFNDAHLIARDYFWDGAHPTLGPVRQLGSPMRFSASSTRRASAAPRLGEDTVAVLEEAGYGRDEIDALVAAKVVRTPAAGAPAV